MRMHRECLIAYPPFHVRLLANLPTALPDVLVSLQVNANDVHASADAQCKHNSTLQYTDLRDHRIAVQKMIALRYTMSEEFDAFPHGKSLFYLKIFARNLFTRILFVSPNESLCMVVRIDGKNAL